MRMKTGGRLVLCFAFILTLMVICIFRLHAVATSDKVKANLTSNSYKINISNLRKTVFDTNLNPITNDTYTLMAVVSPTPRAVTAISSVISGERLDCVLDNLKNNIPALAEVNNFIECSGIKCVKVYKHNKSNMAAPQLIGYVDSTGHGVSGIEAAYDSILYTDETLTAYIPKDTKGNILSGGEIELSSNNGILNSGVALTIDLDIQNAVEAALTNIKSGAAVVSEVSSGKIRAMVSMPQFDVTNVSESLDNEDAPMVNRAISPYNVGSAFKPCVAAAVLEQNLYTNYLYNCRGSTAINGHTFNCHNRSGHGSVNLAKALMYSCNTFFYNIVQSVGADSVYNMASGLSFGKSIKIADNIYTGQGSLTDLQTLRDSPTALANLAIGQGELLLSPVSILTLYQSIANNGVYNLPTVVEGTVENGKITDRYDGGVPTVAMSEQTANTVKKYLKGVIESGTGKAAMPKLTTAAGKTATAETGWKKGDKIIQNSWFCGFFPYENPKYVVAVLIEDEILNGTSGAPVFARIADNITSIKK